MRRSGARPVLIAVGVVALAAAGIGGVDLASSSFGGKHPAAHTTPTSGTAPDTRTASAVLGSPSEASPGPPTPKPTAASAGASGTHGNAAAPAPGPTVSPAATSPSPAVTPDPNPVTGAVLDARGLCMDNADARPTAGNREDVFHCNGTSAQVWTYVPADGSLQVQGYCADVGNGTATAGADLVINSCDGGPGQVFRTRAGGEMYNPHSGLCITDPGASTVMNTLLLMEPCGQAGQDWILPS